MKKKVIAGIVILAVALGVIAFKPTLAWFIENGPAKKQTVDLGSFDVSLVTPCDIRSSYTDPLDSEKYIAPGENMIYVNDPEDGWTPGAIAVVNKSTILTNLRVKIEYTHISSGGVRTQVVYSDTQQEDFTVVFANTDNWEYENGYWNYRYGGTTGSIDIPAADPTTGETINLINSMGYSDELLPNNIYEDEPVTIIFKVEAKQAEYGTWAQVTP